MSEGMKTPSGFEPTTIDSEVVFQTKPRMFGWGWWTIPSLFIRYYVKPGNIAIKRKRGGRDEIDVGSKDANLSATIESSSWKAWLFESILDQKDVTFHLDGKTLKWKNVKNAKEAREFVKKVAKGEYPMPALAEIPVRVGKVQTVAVNVIALMLGLILAYPIVAGALIALLHEGFDIDDQKTIDAAWAGGIIYIIVVMLIYSAMMNIIEDIIFSNREERSENIGWLFKAIGVWLLLSIVIGTLVYVGHRIFV